MGRKEIRNDEDSTSGVVNVGDRYGLLTIQKRDTQKKSLGIHWVCKCTCGTIRTVRQDHLRSGATRGCRVCLMIRHGMSRHPLYSVWDSIKSRGCCDAWCNFEVFQAWAMSNGWQKGHWIHRKGDKGNYNPDNCFIAPRQYQAAHGKSHHAKLTPQEVDEIRRQSKLGVTNRALSRKYGVTESHISNIKTFKVWKVTT